MPTAGGLVLAIAMLCDVWGIRANGATGLDLLRYSGASSLMTATAIIAVWSARGISLFQLLREHGKICYLGALLLLGSYLCGMWAYTHGPVSLVAPLRESGILLGGLLAVFFLRERICETQWAAMAIATAGIVILQLR